MMKNVNYAKLAGTPKDYFGTLYPLSRLQPEAPRKRNRVLGGKNDEIIQNALRLLVKARSMRPDLAAAYIAPLVTVVELYPGHDGEKAATALLDLIHCLTKENDVAPDVWDTAVTALNSLIVQA